MQSPEIINITSRKTDLLRVIDNVDAADKCMISLQSNKFARFPISDPHIPLTHYEGSFGRDLSGEVLDDELYQDGIGIDRPGNLSQMERR